jgi:hypothetical protein
VVGWAGEDGGMLFALLPGRAEVVSIAVVELIVGTGAKVKADVWLIDSSHVVVALLGLAFC